MENRYFNYSSPLSYQLQCANQKGLNLDILNVHDADKVLLNLDRSKRTKRFKQSLENLIAQGLRVGSMIEYSSFGQIVSAEVTCICRDGTIRINGHCGAFSPLNILRIVG